MMRQFEVLVCGGQRILTLANPSRYDLFWGFRVYIKELK